eukprot:TRINITY_DN5324_c0_g1_i1.p2 TRINITY_DN5324_c0_g1~~TRINITY_DN5324_c0_g1_i1.p2  ORF type:complete len:144 (-),score=30.89 TRINITY_DN5324_c0_g1_i1:60-491(-)
MVCFDMENKGVCPREYCRWCPDKEDPKGGGKGGDKGGFKKVKQTMWKKEGKGEWGKKGGKGDDGKGKNKNFSPFCESMKRTGSCPRGEDCRWCQKMIERYGTNDWNEASCWNVAMKGECTLRFCKWCPDKESPDPEAKLNAQQ